MLWPFESLDKIHGKKLIAYLLTIFALIAPGASYLFILYFLNQSTLSTLFRSLDSFRLLLLSLLFSLPLFIAGLAFTATDLDIDEKLKSSDKKDKEETNELVFSWLIDASLLTLFSVYISIFLIYYYHMIDNVLAQLFLYPIYAQIFIYFTSRKSVKLWIGERFTNMRLMSVKVLRKNWTKIIFALLLTLVTYLTAGSFVNGVFSFSLIHYIIVFALWLLILLKFKK